MMRESLPSLLFIVFAMAVSFLPSPIGEVFFIFTNDWEFGRLLPGLDLSEVVVYGEELFLVLKLGL